MKKVLAASPVAALPKLDFQSAKTLINEATVSWWLGSTTVIFVLLLCVECKALAALFLAAGLGMIVAAVNGCTNLFVKTALQLQVLKEYRTEETQLLEVGELLSSQHTRVVDMEMPASDAYDRAMQALTALPGARVTKIKMLDGVILAEAAHGVRLKVKISEVTDNRSHLVLHARTDFLHELFHADRSLQMLLHLRRHVNSREEYQPQQMLKLFQPSIVRSTIKLLKVAAAAGILIFAISTLVTGIQEGRHATEARAQFRIGNYDAVIQSTSRIMRQTPEVVSMRAIALANTGKTDEAIALLSKNISREGEDSLYVYRAYAHVIAGDIGDALAELDMAEEMPVHMDFKHYVRALIAEHNNDYEQAADELAVAIELNSDEPVFHRENAKVLKKLKESDEAMKEVARAEAIAIEEQSELNTETGGTIGEFVLLAALICRHRMRARKRMQPAA